MPYHTQIIITLLSGSLTFCLALAFAGAFFRNRRALPPVPLFPNSHFPGFFTQFYTAFFLITFVFSTAAECISPSSKELTDENLPELLMSAGIQTLLYLPLLIVYFSQPARPRPHLSVFRKLAWCILGVLVLLFPAGVLQLSGFNNWLIETTGCPAQQDVVESLQHGSPGIQIILIVMAVIIAPITEECCFRGCLYNILKRYSSPVLAAAGSGLLFGAIHTSLAQVIPLTLFGIFQCYAYEKARSLWLPVTLHMLFNAISVTLLLLCPIP